MLVHFTLANISFSAIELQEQVLTEEKGIPASSFEWTMKIPLACLLLLFSSAICQDQRVRERYRKFIKQHINVHMSRTRCDAEISQRRISKTDSNECKETNTFIRANTNLVKRICGGAGEPAPDQMRKSLQPFDVVVCTLRNEGARHPHCQYRGASRTRRIAIKCEQDFPVHFDRDIVVFDN
ncbi:ribonuclease-like 3 [Poeciliopsis prolifica]|uniref:ribonuclease-like 3 n=1 Tax=Poeciliopsis prolifica TaxID=188132 RepID=UPI0024141E00|nr:ribonuclease-like 3 [Poeciliopsis prolifica]